MKRNSYGTAKCRTIYVGEKTVVLSLSADEAVKLATALLNAAQENTTLDLLGWRSTAKVGVLSKIKHLKEVA